MRKLKLEELGRVDIEEFKSILKTPIIVVLDNIRSAMNVGSFFRTCDAFKIEKIILCGITARPPHKEIFKTAIGATQSVEWEYQSRVEDAMIHLKKDGFLIVGIEQTDESISLADYIRKDFTKVALVFGNEVQGLSPEILPLIDQAIEIPQYGTKHSLNVSVCGGIVIWEYAKIFLNIDPLT